jgi:aspartate racemase
MKQLGLIGGTSWLSTIDYYRLINLGVNEKLGGLNFSRCIIYSFNYEDIRRNHATNNWEKTLQMVSEAGIHLKNSGAEAIVLCANTMHLIAAELEEIIGLPVIHIATAIATAIAETGINKVALLGTRFTMERAFFTSKLQQQNIETIIPEEADREFIHQTIFEELGRGEVIEATRQRYLHIIRQLTDRGAAGIILGCTEIPMLIKPEDVSVPVFDTTTIHAAAAVAFSMGEAL